VLLQRLDDAPDDILILLETLALRDLGWADVAYQDASLILRPGGILWKIGAQEIPVSEGPSPLPDVSTVSLGFLSPSLSAP
jgi:hypothetical protein